MNLDLLTVFPRSLYFDFHLARIIAMPVRNILLPIICLIKHTSEEKNGQIKIGIMWSSSGSGEVKQ